MAVQYRVDPAARLVRTTFTGVVTHRDPTDNAIRLRCDPAFDPGFSELIQFEEGSEINLNFWDFRSDLDPFSKTSKRALVAGKQRAVYGIARMFQIARNDDANVRIFATTDEAEAWLVTEP